MVRILLTTKKCSILAIGDENETIVKYTLPEDNENIFSTEFKLTIPSEEEFIKVIEDEKLKIYN